MSAVLRTGYKQTEVGVIPEDWEVASIGNLCSAVLDCHHSTPVWTTTGEVVIRNQNIREGKLDLSQPSYTDAGHFAERTRRATPTHGDLVITREAPMGLVCMIPEGLKCCLGQRMVLLRPDSTAIEAPYLLYSILSEAVQRAISVAGGTGSTVANLRIPVLKGLLIAAPSPPEQRAIAAALSDVDALLGGLESLIAKKKGLKVAAMQQLLTGQTRLPGFSGEWEERTLNEVCWFQEGPGVRNTQFTTSGIKLLNGTNIFRGVLNLDTTTRFISEAEAYGPYAHFMAEEGNIVLASSGITIDRLHEKVAVVRRENLPFCMNTSTIRFKPISGISSSEFLYHFLVSDRFKTQIGGVATGSAQLNFGPSHVSRVSLSVPGIPEQTAIAVILSDMDTELAALQTRRSKTQALKQAMMQELLTGRIRLI